MHQTALISCLPAELVLLPWEVIIQGRKHIFKCLYGTYHSGGHTIYSVVCRLSIIPWYGQQVMDREMPRGRNGEDLGGAMALAREEG